ncbi:unnamed protein product [Rotaria sp. Silwood2]|nr:unnamed protein product [Rotaria sp. Silwood2]CAF2991653.1 unnamed protein product [Rotaria sp. Silwood2]CAF3340572.1 unnamed protein product [Rotaria sp. Silwood2]CAF4415194.1 unnamed protein product [Rotaria sp. Silwood2]CAF4466604.1 unnamed protein product [Rotaria sp. Silwood2]
MSTTHTHGTRFAVRQASKQNLPDSSQLPPSVASETPSTFSSSSRLNVEKKKTVPSRKIASTVRKVSKPQDKLEKCRSTIDASELSDSSITAFSTTIDDISLSKTNTSILSSNNNVTARSLSSDNNSVIQNLSTTEDVGLKISSSSEPNTSTININRIVLDFQAKLKAKDAIIKNLKNKIEECNKIIANLHESSMTIPTEPLVIDWIDHMYELVHKEEIQSQLNFKQYADLLNIDEQAFNNCIQDKDRIKTARSIVRCFSGYEQLIAMQNAWTLIDKDKIDIVIDFVRKLFGPSLSTTDNIVRTSLSTMVRSDSWKARGKI